MYMCPDSKKYRASVKSICQVHKNVIYIYIYIFRYELRAVSNVSDVCIMIYI